MTDTEELYSETKSPANQERDGLPEKAKAMDISSNQACRLVRSLTRSSPLQTDDFLAHS